MKKLNRKYYFVKAEHNQTHEKSHFRFMVSEWNEIKKLLTDDYTIILIDVILCDIDEYNSRFGIR